MTSMRWRIEDNLSPAIRARLQAAEDLTPAMQGIADHLEFSTRRRFETSIGPDGVRWKPSTRFRKIGRGKNRRVESYQAEKPLVDSGQLLASIDRAFTRTTATVGTNLIYARIQQLGGTITAKNGKGLSTPFGVVKSVTLPARPFIGIDAADRQAIIEILVDHLGGGAA